MLVQTSFYLFLVILGDVVNGYKASGTPQNEGSIKKTYSRSQSCYSSSTSSHSSSTVQTDTHVGCHEDKCDRNSTYKRCPNPCPETCQNPKGVTVCNKMCLAHGCECNSGYVVGENGKCVKLKDCPDYLRCNDRNATFKGCPNPCPATCALPGRAPCNKACLKEGCECKEGFYLNDKRKCVALQDCPGAKTCSSNETFAFCKVGCPTNNCPKDDNRGIIACSPPYPCGSGCVCKGGYLRSTDNRCILYSDCPPINCTRPNEVYCARPPSCLFEDCTDIGKDKKCDRTYPNIPQCICKPGFYRNNDSICVPEKECYPSQVCGYNEAFSKCKITCPPQDCDSIFTSYMCAKMKCEAGCNCLGGHLRNKSKICVPSEQCFPAPQCDVSPECRPTCANPNPNCRLVHLPTNSQENQDGCQCMKGYVLTETNGVCIKIEECPDQGCNGDPNSKITSCPWPSPSTCKSPDAGSNGKTCDQIGCQCKLEFILNKDNGTCILPDDCKCGNPCGPNGTFSECAFRCPNQDCPTNDSRSKVACKPGRPCPSGCICKPYHLRNQDGDCILASDCTPVECIGDNEVWNPCASECLAESCDDLIATSDCFPDPQNCQPQCVCCKGYYRDKSGACVHKKKCPINCKIQQECRPTCAVPNPPNCPYIPPSNTNVDGCNCQTDYVLSYVGGKCIKIEECPTNQTCNGDSNAVVKKCPLPCPSTCDSPNATPCKRKCDPIGCECKPGYIKFKNGTCIRPEQCEGGNPCGKNETFSSCRYQCPTNYCPKDDSRAVVVCETSPFSSCYSGCSCKLNYKRNNTDDPRCILASECTHINCTRQNEEWCPCPEECNSEYCDAVDNPPSVCNTLVLNCNPKCVCKKSYFRNDKDLCVSSKECRKLNKRKRVTPSY